VEEWLVSAVMSIYTGTETVVRTVYGNSSGFEAKVSIHQGSAVSSLLFVIVIEAISTEFRVALPWELLYADDLVVIAETEADLIKRLNEWKDNVENRGIKVNMNKTKVMISEERQKPVQKAARWPCGVCGRGVGSNLIQCTVCQQWVHKKCSGIKDSLCKAMKSFICRGCSNPVISTGHTTTTTVLWPFLRDHPGEPAPEENFWTLWCKGRLTRNRHTDNPARRHSIRTNHCPAPPSPHFFTGWMPFLSPNQQCQSTECNNQYWSYKCRYWCQCKSGGSA